MRRDGVGISAFAIAFAISLSIGWGFYKWASIDLKAAVQTLKDATDDVNVEIRNSKFLTELILKALQQAGMTELNVDDDGNITGLVFRLQAEAGQLKIVSFAPKASLSAKENPDTP